MRMRQRQPPIKLLRKALDLLLFNGSQRIAHDFGNARFLLGRET